MPRLRFWWTIYGVASAVDATLALIQTPATDRARRWTKPALMPVLAAAVATSPGGDGRLRRSTLAALGLSWVGDIALLGTGERAFLGGLAAFLGAHVVYTAGFATTPATVPPGTRRAPGEPALLAAAALLTPGLATLAYRRDRSLAGPVVAYGTVLSAMALSAVRLGHRAPGPGRTKVTYGVLLFLLSDALLGAGTFLFPRPPRGVDAAVMVTYCLAQGLIAAGVTARDDRADGAAPTDRSVD